MSLEHFVLQFTRVSNGVGGAAWVNIVEIWKVLAMALRCWVYYYDLMDMFLQCMHSIWMAQFSCSRFNS